MRLQHGGIFVAHQKFDAAVLPALKPTRLRQIRTNGTVLRWCHGGQNIPCVHQLLHDAADTRQFFEGIGQLVGGNISHGRGQLMAHQLHPQLAGLVLHDEQHFVVVRRERLLGIQDGIELQVVAIAHATFKIELGFFFMHDVLAQRGVICRARTH